MVSAMAKRATLGERNERPRNAKYLLTGTNKIAAPVGINRWTVLIDMKAVPSDRMRVQAGAPPRLRSSGTRRESRARLQPTCPEKPGQAPLMTLTRAPVEAESSVTELPRPGKPKFATQMWAPSEVMAKGPLNP